MSELRGCKRFCIARLVNLLQLLNVQALALSRVEDHLAQLADQITVPT